MQGLTYILDLVMAPFTGSGCAGGSADNFVNVSMRVSDLLV